MNEEEKIYEKVWNEIINAEFQANPIFKDVLRELIKNLEGYQWRCVEEALMARRVFNEKKMSIVLERNSTKKIVGNRMNLARALKHLGSTEKSLRAIAQNFGASYPTSSDNIAKVEIIKDLLGKMLPTEDNDEYSPFDKDRLTESPNDYSFESTDNSIASVHEGCIQAGQDGTCIIMMQKSKDKDADRKYYKVKVKGRQLYDASKNPPSLVSTDKPIEGGKIYDDNKKSDSPTSTDQPDEGGQNPAPTPAPTPAPAPAPTPTTSGSENGHEFVDLGLSVKWATCNVGAGSPGEYGDYIAWGQTSPKCEYEWSTLKYCNDTTGDSFSKYNQNQGGTKDNRTRLELSDDAARQQWGGSWRMPTREEFQELLDKCRWSWTTEGGHKGYKVTGPNGNSIFLPAAGCCLDSSLYYAGEDGYYWSSSLNTSYSYSADSLGFSSGGHLVGSSYRFIGQRIRPVTE